MSRPGCENPRQVQFAVEALPPLTALEAEWRRLEAVAEPSFFVSWHWIGTLLAAIPPESRPSLLRGTVAGETAALALLGAGVVRRRHGLVRSRTLFLNETGDPHFDTPMIEHNGLLVAPGFAAHALEGLTRWFAGQAAAADELRIAGSTQRLPDHWMEGVWRSETAEPYYWVDLSRLADARGELYPVLSANARQQLRRARRHFEQIGPLTLEPAQTLPEALAFFADLKKLHCAYWDRRGRPHAFARPFFEAFHRLLIARNFSSGTVRLLRARAGDRLIGYLYNFRLGERVCAYQSGFAYNDRNDRPGAVAHAMAIRDAWRSGAVVYDFLAGTNRLKQSFATDRGTMLWQIVQQPRIAFQVEHLARRAKRQAEPLLAELSRRKNRLLRPR